MADPGKYRSISTVDFVLEQFKEMIARGEVSHGDLLPSESVLSERLGVSRGSVREGMKILSAFGIVEIKRGNGTYVSENVSDSILEPILLGMLLDSKDIDVMAEFREAIEKSVVNLAVMNALDEDLEALRAVITAMEALLAEDDSLAAVRAQWVEADLSFHRTLGAATHNPLMEKLYAFIMRFFEPTVENTYVIPRNGQQALELHRGMMLAIEARDSVEAAAAAVRSIQAWKQVFAKGDESHDHR